MDCQCPIKHLDILPTIDGGSVIYWTLQPSIEIPAGATVAVQTARYATADNSVWSTLATVPYTNGYIIDVNRYALGIAEQIYYRAVFSSPPCTTDPVPSLMGKIPCTQRPMLREIIRREQLRHKNNEAQQGTLLKRKYSGTLCTICTNPDFPEQQINSYCETCYGTGWVGGYFINPNFYLDMAEHGFSNKRGEYRRIEGEHNATQIQYLNIPDVQPGDVWVDKQSDHRWQIEKVHSLFRLGSYVVTAQADVRKLNFEDVVYKFQLP